MRYPGPRAQILTAAAAVLLLVTPSEAYYHYVHYLSSNLYSRA